MLPPSSRQTSIVAGILDGTGTLVCPCVNRATASRQDAHTCERAAVWMACQGIRAFACLPKISPRLLLLALTFAAGGLSMRRSKPLSRLVLI